MASGLTRRSFLKAAAGGIAALPVLHTTRTRAQRPEAIRFGFTTSRSGPYALGADLSHLSNYTLWAEHVNARGGIMVKDLGRRLPVHLVQYDDKSDIETAVRLFEKLMTSDNVEFVLPAWGTAMHFAVAPVANRFKYPLIGPTVTSLKLKEMGLPWFFVIIQQADAINAALVGILKELRRRQEFHRVAMLYVGDLYGIEFSGGLAPLLPVEGFEMVELKSYPLGVKDVSTVLKGLKAKNVEALISHSYPPDGMLVTAQAKETGFNPKVFYAGVGAIFPFFRDRFGPATEGIIGPGAWSPKVPFAGSREYYEAFRKRWNKEPDHWGGPLAYASLQIYEQAIEKTGTLNRERIREALASESFTTIVGPVKFTRNFNLETPGLIHQWQKGAYEIIWPKERATAEPIYPKPAWA